MQEPRNGFRRFKGADDMASISRLRLQEANRHNCGLSGMGMWKLQVASLCQVYTCRPFQHLCDFTTSRENGYASNVERDQSLPDERKHRLAFKWRVQHRNLYNGE